MYSYPTGKIGATNYIQPLPTINVRRKSNHLHPTQLNPTRMVNLRHFKGINVPVAEKKKVVYQHSEGARIARVGRGAFKFLIMFLDMSSIHGLNHLTKATRHPAEICIWLVFVIMALSGAIYLSIGTWQRYQENPIVISMERDRFSWNTTFPPATICPSFKWDTKKLDKFVKESDCGDKANLVIFLQKLANATYHTFGEVPDNDCIAKEQYMDVLLAIQFEFEPSVSNSGSSGAKYSLQKVITEMDICYTFNSKMAIYFNPDYWRENRWNYVKGNDTFYVHPLDGEVFTNVVNMSTGFDMYLHGPYELVDISSKKIHSAHGFFLQVYLTGLTIFTSASAGDLKVGQRKCRFPTESNLVYTPVYSYTVCRIECRIKLAKRLCGCVPHFYRHIGLFNIVYLSKRRNGCG